MKHHHDFLKELNESNVELYINNKKYKYQKYFIPDKEGEYNILLKFNILIKDCSFMFYECSNIINIDLSSFNTKNVTNMSDMFYYCKELKNIDLSSFNTQKVNDIVDKYGNIFYGCSRLERVILNFEESKIKKLIQSDKIIYS